MNARSRGRRYRRRKMAPKKILIVEDHPDSLDLLQNQLRRMGYPDLVVATNGPDALQRALDEKPDLILLDIAIPGMTGLEVARRLKGDGATRPILILALTAKAMPGDREACLDSGCDAYLAKPFLPRHLKAEIEKLFGKPD